MVCQINICCSSGGVGGCVCRLQYSMVFGMLQYTFMYIYLYQHRMRNTDVCDSGFHFENTYICEYYVHFQFMNACQQHEYAVAFVLDAFLHPLHDFPCNASECASWENTSPAHIKCYGYEEEVRFLLITSSIHIFTYIDINKLFLYYYYSEYIWILSYANT